MKNNKFSVDSDKKEVLETALKNLKADELDIFDALINLNSSPWGTGAMQKAQEEDIVR
jgi:hypothetical protein